MKRNLLLLWIRDALNTGAAALTSTSVLSAFFLRSGLSEGEIGFYLALTPFVNFVISLLFSGITGRVRNTLRAYSVTGFLTAAATLGFLFLCHENIPGGIFFFAVLLFGCLISVFSAIKSIFDYKLPCELMDLSDYSVYVSVNGILGGVIGIVCAAILAQLYAVLPFYPVTGGAFLGAGLFLAAGSVLNGRLRVLHPAKTTEQQTAAEKPTGNRSAVRTLFTDRDFLFLILPNFVRGFGAGALSLVSVIAASACHMNESGLAFITVCTYLATLVSCLFYTALSRRFGATVTGVLGGIVFCLIIPCFAGGSLLFFVLYTLSYIGFNIMSCAVPESVYQYVPEDRVSAFHTWRLALTTLGTTLSTAVFGKLLDRIPPVVLMAIGAVSVLVCVIGYQLCFRKRKKNG